MLHALLFLVAASMSDADAAYAQHHYKDAAALYTQIVHDDATNARAWYRLGVSDAAIGSTGDAVAAFGHALQLGYDPMSVHYRLASVWAAQSDATAAADELRQAFAARRFDPTSLADDRAFDNVRNAPPFAALIAQQTKAFFPCRYDAAYHALDYWKGDWDVKNTSGALVGHSHIEGAADQCAIIERWTGVYDAPGGSISAYDATSKQWAQHYVSGRGAVSDYTGRILADGSLEFIAASGAKRTRMTFTKLADGTVRQRFEVSSDGGATWSKPNDLLYIHP